MGGRGAATWVRRDSGLVRTSGVPDQRASSKGAVRPRGTRSGLTPTAGTAQAAVDTVRLDELEPARRFTSRWRHGGGGDPAWSLCEWGEDRPFGFVCTLGPLPATGRGGPLRARKCRCDAPRPVTTHPDLGSSPIAGSVRQSHGVTADARWPSLARPHIEQPLPLPPHASPRRLR